MIKCVNWVLSARHLWHSKDASLLPWWLALRDYKRFIIYNCLNLVYCTIMQWVSIPRWPLVFALVDNYEAWIVRVFIEGFSAFLIRGKWGVLLAVESIRAAIIFIFANLSIQNLCSYVIQNLLSFLVVLFHRDRYMEVRVWLIHLREVNRVVASIDCVGWLPLLMNIGLIHDLCEWLLYLFFDSWQILLFLQFQHLNLILALFELILQPEILWINIVYLYVQLIKCIVKFKFDFPLPFFSEFPLIFVHLMCEFALVGKFKFVSYLRTLLFEFIDHLFMFSSIDLPHPLKFLILSMQISMQCCLLYFLLFQPVIEVLKLLVCLLQPLLVWKIVSACLL